MRAETLWALKCVQNNYSFQSNDGNSCLFKKMFPDSKIAAGYEMAKSKIKYIVQFGIKKYVVDQLIEDIQGSPFSFKFDETTTAQIKKQYDGYVQYSSEKFKKIITHYAGSLFLGHCKSDQLKEHFFDFMKNLKLDVNFLIHIGMDGPNVNLAFQKSLEKDLFDKNGKMIINIGTCSLHPVHTGFMKGLKQLTYDLNKLAYDLHFFFKYSSARREDLKLCELITELDVKFTIKHTQTRWLSLKKVLERIKQQWPNLKEYFLSFLPKQLNFTREFARNERYVFIKESLSSDTTLLYIGFVIHVADILENFLVKFQSKNSLLPMLYIGFGDLFFQLMSNFLNPKILRTQHDIRESASVLGKLDVSDSKNQLSIHAINYGTYLKNLIANIEAKKNIDSIKTEFKMTYLEITKYLQKMWPHDSTFLKNVQYLHPKKIKSDRASHAIGKIAYTLANVLKMSSYLTSKTPEEFSDIVMNEVKMLGSDSNSIKTCDEKEIQRFYEDIGNVEDLHGNKQYKNLAELAKTCLCINQTNADPERGFSINKEVIEGRVMLKEDTIIALRFVKDHILHHGGVENFPITRQLLNYVANARNEYQKYLEDERSKSVVNEKRKREADEIEQQRKRVKKDVAQMKIAITEKETELKSAQNLVDTGNKMLENELKNKQISKQKLQQAKAMIDMGLNKQKTIKKEIDSIKLKLEKSTHTKNK